MIFKLFEKKTRHVSQWFFPSLHCFVRQESQQNTQGMYQSLPSLPSHPLKSMVVLGSSNTVSQWRQPCLRTQSSFSLLQGPKTRRGALKGDQEAGLCSLGSSLHGEGHFLGGSHWKWSSSSRLSVTSGGSSKSKWVSITTYNHRDLILQHLSDPRPQRSQSGRIHPQITMLRRW